MAKEKKSQEMFYVFNYFCIDEGRTIHLGIHDGNVMRLGMECFQVHDGRVTEVVHPDTRVAVVEEVKIGAVAGKVKETRVFKCLLQALEGIEEWRVQSDRNKNKGDSVLNQVEGSCKFTAKSYRQVDMYRHLGKCHGKLFPNIGFKCSVCAELFQEKRHATEHMNHCGEVIKFGMGEIMTFQPEFLTNYKKLVVPMVKSELTLSKADVKRRKLCLNIIRGESSLECTFSDSVYGILHAANDSASVVQNCTVCGKHFIGHGPKHGCDKKVVKIVVKEKKVDVAVPSTSKPTREETQVEEEQDNVGDVEVEVIETNEIVTCTKPALHDLGDLEKVDAANKMVEKYKKELNEALETIGNKEKLARIEAKNVAKKEKLIASLEAKDISNNEKIASLEVEREKRRKDMVELERDLKDLKELNKTVQSRNEELDEEICFAKDKAIVERTAASDEIEKLKKEKEVVEQQNETLQREMAEMEKKCTQLKFSNKSLGRNQSSVHHHAWKTS